MSSPFLLIPESEWVASNTLAFAIRDASPASPGHTLVIPRRPVATWFDATAKEQRALFELVDEVKRGLDAELKPDGHSTMTFTSTEFTSPNPESRFQHKSQSGPAPPHCRAPQETSPQYHA
ncbi:HIT family protein [Myxococcus eversor]|uniref:HIT family protein n=1 Tax=Myxococcus eversor TaxID=2709661 RepID=UPI001F076BB7|nr:HIT family protein [Myxococcus eversor]